MSDKASAWATDRNRLVSEAPRSQPKKSLVGKLFRKGNGSASTAGQSVETLAPDPLADPISDAQLAADIAAHDAAGRYAESLVLIDKALAARPDSSALFALRASTLFAWGRFREAWEELSRAGASGPVGPELHVQLGWSCYYTGRLDEAESWMRQAVQHEPENWRGHFGLAATLQAQRNLDDACSSYARGIELKPDDIQAHIMLGICKLEGGDAAAAETQFRRSVALDAGAAIAWANLGVALGRQDRFDEALTNFEHASRLEEEGSEPCDSFVNFATTLREAGRSEEALNLYARSVVHRPNVDGLGDYSLALLTDGQFALGWRLYEFRWTKNPLLPLRPGFPMPAWTGQDLRGKVLLLCGEQGFGDIIHFIRYAPLIKKLGATVWLLVRTGLGALPSSFPGVDRIYEQGSDVPRFDFYASLMGLPRVFRTELSSIPADIPYLRPDQARVDRWKPRFAEGGTVKIGLVWAGNPSHTRDRLRSTSLRQLAPLLAVSGASFYSLQKGKAAGEMATLDIAANLDDLGSELDDFADTAAVVDQLDLIISVDTVVAHLAGALGKPVWLLLPQLADFRWLETREDSPWYPTMRLFRQFRRGEWADVVDRVKSELQKLVSGQACLPMAVQQEFQVDLQILESREKNLPRSPPGLSAIAECRDGLFQYLPDEPTVGDSLAWYGEYLQGQLDLLTSLIPSGATIVEVGAGVGTHSVRLAQAVGDMGQLLLYESRPTIQRMLRQNIVANRAANVTIMRRTIGLPNSQANRYTPSADRPSTTDPVGSVIETLDQLGLRRLDWIKINAGASAVEVVTGAAATLWRLRPRLYISVPEDGALAEIGARLREFGYRTWRHCSSVFNADNFNRRDENIFGDQIALALLAIPEEVDVDVPLVGCVDLS